MRFAISSLVSTFHDAALSPEAWPRALKALADACGAAGAALIVSSKSTGNVDDACFSGLVALRKRDGVTVVSEGVPARWRLKGAA
jgi:hypothetical protein